MLSRGQSGETTTAAFLDEGGRTIGVWLPLAMADVKAMLMVLARMWTTNPEKVDIPTRSECLESWCLPMMASSLKAAEEEQKALELFGNVKRMADKQKAKAERENQ